MKIRRHAEMWVFLLAILCVEVQADHLVRRYESRRPRLDANDANTEKNLDHQRELQFVGLEAESRKLISEADCRSCCAADCRSETRSDCFHRRCCGR